MIVCVVSSVQCSLKRLAKTHLTWSTSAGMESTNFNYTVFQKRETPNSSINQFICDKGVVGSSIITVLQIYR